MTAGNTLFHMVRRLSQPALAYGSDDPAHGRMVVAVEAVHRVKQRGLATINDIAAELGIDQSGASRLMSQAISAGYAYRDRVNADGRARECGLTTAGEELLAGTLQRRQQVFEQLTDGWSESERKEFEHQLSRVLTSADSLARD